MTIPKSSPNLVSANNPYLTVELDAYKELLRHAQQIFNIHIFAVGASVFVIFLGLWLLYTGNNKEGTVATSVGAGAVAYCSKLAKESSRESSERIKRLLKEIREVKSLQLPRDTSETDY
jgi:hypothetical protein